MLEYNVDINGNKCFPPLISAIESGDDEIVNFLLDENADHLITYNVSILNNIILFNTLIVILGKKYL